MASKSSPLRSNKLLKEPLQMSKAANPRSNLYNCKTSISTEIWKMVTFVIKKVEDIKRNELNSSTTDPFQPIKLI
jgi:hypothetical protein